MTRRLRPYQPDAMNVIKTCRTCGHRFGQIEHSQCALTGFFCQVQRKFPSPPCDINFSGWVAREPSLLERILRRLFS